MGVLLQVAVRKLNASREADQYFQSLVKQQYQTFAGSSLSNVRSCCFSFLWVKKTQDI